MPNNILALDVGDRRVGVALARAGVRVPVLLPTLDRADKDFWTALSDCIHEHTPQAVVIGLPRGLDGQETAQTASVREFAAELGKRISVPLVWQDEAGTSVQAETVLRAGGKPYDKGDIDGVAASLILADYLQENEAKV